jgi:hypothetical protein
MPERTRPPKFIVTTLLAFGLLASLAAFATHRFLLLFFTAGSLWVVVSAYLYRRWWPGIPFVPDRRKSYRGITILPGFIIFGCAWYVIGSTHPSNSGRNSTHNPES